MELQWPLIIFTTLVAWSAGLFASQCVLALQGKGIKAQMPAWITSAALLVVGGIAVFFHLENWTRIFNGFGHLSSGITQELIAIVILAAIAVVYLAMMRKNEGKVPSWVAILGIVASVALVVVMAHSYMMAARPAWDSVLWIVYVLGNACVLGPLTMAALCALYADEGEADGSKLAGILAVAGSAVNAVAAAAYGIVLQMSGSSFTSLGNYFDHVHPNKAMIDPAAIASDQMLLIWGGAVVLGAVVPLVCAFLANKKGEAASWKTLGLAGVACAVIGAVLMRVAFYNMGISVFPMF